MKDRENCVKFIPGNICINFECNILGDNCVDGPGCDNCNGPKCNNFDCDNCVNYKDKQMKNGYDFCDGFICKDVDKCINPNDKDCSDNCDWFCNCSACRYNYDVETEQCYEKKSTEELMENGHFWTDENGDARPYED